MATTSEIQVTEAYIGLLGRAPDPDGLAYWAAQLDPAVAAGQDPAVALKKLTNDITLSDEWDNGIGANDPLTEAGATEIVTDMYQNLFDRDPTADDLEYWTGELMDETFTASEMAVALIQGAGDNTDGDVLGYKQEAATYYVETITAEQFNQESAAASVADVNGPISLQASKETTDQISTGTGINVTLTTGDDSDDLVMTVVNDTITGTVGTGATYNTATDDIVDSATFDQDVLNLSGDDGFTFGTVTNVETINVDLEAAEAAGLTIEAADVTGGQINISMASTTDIGGIDVPGEQVLTINNMSADLDTVGVTDLTVGMADDATISITADDDATSVSVSNVNAATITLANDDTSVTVGGQDGANDALTISADGAVALDTTDGGNDVDILTLSGNTAAVTYTITDAGDAVELNVVGEQDVTISGSTGLFNGVTLTDGSTGDINIVLTDTDASGDDADIESFGVMDSFSIGGALSNDSTITLESGNVVSIDADQTAALTFDANDATNASEITIDANNDAAGITTTGFGTTRIDTGADPVSLGAVAADNDVTIVGTNDVTVAGISASSSGDLLLDAQALTSTGNISFSNDISLTLDDGLSMAASDIASAAGTVTVTASQIDANDISALGAVSLTATNESQVSSIGNDISGSSVTLAGGNWSIQNDVTATSGNLTISGADTLVAIGGNTSAKAVVVAGGNDVDLGTVEARVVNAGSATADVTLTYNDSDNSVLSAGQTAIVTTGSGHDSITIDDGVNPVTITTGDGNDSVTLTQSAAGTKVTMGDGDTHTLSIGNAGAGAADVTATMGDGDATIRINTANDATVTAGDGDHVLTITAGNDVTATLGDGDSTVTVTAVTTGADITTGAGDDTFTVTSSSNGVVIDAGAGDDSITLNNDSGTQFDGGTGTDSVTLAAGDYSSNDMSFSNIETLTIQGATTLSDSNLQDSSFEMVGNFTLTVNAMTNDATTIDVSAVTKDEFATGLIDINGNDGDDTLTGNNMVNVIHGSAGNDTITGGRGADILGGNDGDDTITGGKEGDTITGGAGADIMTGGDGADNFVFNDNDTPQATGGDSANYDVIMDFDGNDSGDNDTITVSGMTNVTPTVAVSTDNGVTETTLADVMTLANANFAKAGGNDVYVSIDAFGSGDTYVFIDADGDDTVGADDVIIILDGVTNDAGEINVGDFI
jgi:Ca2+-binding RTX toxin-like protein